MKMELNQLQVILSDIIYDLRNNRYCFYTKTWSVDLQSVLGDTGEWLIHAIGPLFSGETSVIFIKGEKSSSVIKVGVMDINPTDLYVELFRYIRKLWTLLPKSTFIAYGWGHFTTWHESCGRGKDIWSQGQLSVLLLCNISQKPLTEIHWHSRSRGKVIQATSLAPVSFSSGLQVHPGVSLL